MRVDIFVAPICMLASICFCKQGDIYISRLDPEVNIVLAGRITSEPFRDANEKLEYQYVLSLKGTVTVSGDEYGEEVKGVKQIQIVMLRRNEALRIAANSGAKVFVYGRLFHQVSAHHHTPICIEADSVAVAK